MMRARLPEWAVFVGLTMEPWQATDTIIRSVGFKINFYSREHDCKRHNIDFIICEIKYSRIG